MRKNISVLAAACSLSLLVACAPDPEWANNLALRAGAPLDPEVARELRDVQSASFAGVDERRLQRELTQTLQDLGFTIEESASRIGVFAGSKDRDATETGQVVGQIALTIGLALLGVHYNPVWDRDQIIRVTVTTAPDRNRGSTARVSFERIITNTQLVSRMEVLRSPEFSSGFFDRVRQGLAGGST